MESRKRLNRTRAPKLRRRLSPRISSSKTSLTLQNDAALKKVDAPTSEAELLARAESLAGQNLFEIAETHGIAVPENLLRAKGWVGQLLERALGADASTRSEPDFVALQVELKTIPVDLHGHPRETTFVCTAALSQMNELTWQSSRVFKKLAHVLWIPVEADPGIEIGQRCVGNPLLWRPSPEEIAVLKTDWDAFADRIAAGFVETITASEGEVLHMRPKGANAAARRWAKDEDGVAFQTQPKAFYLRTQFTAQILKRHFALIR
jgi:DNA mismatch repair protein MutH